MRSSIVAVLLVAGFMAVASASYVRIKTNMGDVEAELFYDKAPVTVTNFLNYINSGHYNGLIFHRVIPNFMVQGGGYSIDYKERPTRAPIQNEANNGLLNKRGTLAMA